MNGNNHKPVGILLNLDQCAGCYSCQTACRQTNHFSYEEKWMEVIRRNPVIVDGELRMYHLIAPSLDKCAACVEKENPPLCQQVCMGNCLHVAPVEELLPMLSGNTGKCVLYTP